MDTLQIPIENARKAHELAKSGGNLPTVLEALFGADAITPVRKGGTAITSWEDVLAYHGMSQEAFDAKCSDGDLSEDEIGYRMCKMWAAALNEEWVPDYANGDEPKYHVWMIYEHGSGFRFGDFGDFGQDSTVGSRLVLKSIPLAQHYGKYAVEAINKFFL